MQPPVKHTLLPSLKYILLRIGGGDGAGAGIQDEAKAGKSLQTEVT